MCVVHVWVHLNYTQILKCLTLEKYQSTVEKFLRVLWYQSSGNSSYLHVPPIVLVLPNTGRHTWVIMCTNAAVKLVGIKLCHFEPEDWWRVTKTTPLQAPRGLHLWCHVTQAQPIRGEAIGLTCSYLMSLKIICIWRVHGELMNRNLVQ